MTAQAAPTRRATAGITWTAAGAITAIAALVLMFAIMMITLGASDHDRSEGSVGIVIGGLTALVWGALVVLAGRMLLRPSPGRRGWLAVLPAFASIAWFGAAFGLAASGFLSVIASLGPLPPIIAISLISAGTLPAAFALLVANIVLRLVARRHPSTR